MTRVTAPELRVAISDPLDRVAHHGQRIAVERYGKPVAALVGPEDLDLLEAIEDRLDVETARKALREPGRQRWDEVRAELAPNNPAVWATMIPLPPTSAPSSPRQSNRPGASENRVPVKPSNPSPWTAPSPSTPCRSATRRSARLCQRPEEQALRILGKMAADFGYLNRIGADEHWTLTNDLRRRLLVADDAPEDWAVLKRRVLRVMRRCDENGDPPLANLDVRRITGLDRHQVRRLIGELRTQGLVTLSGSGRGARYVYVGPRGSSR